MERPEGDMSLKNPVTLPGIDAGTFRLVAQRLNHYDTPGPHRQVPDRTIILAIHFISVIRQGDNQIPQHHFIHATKTQYRMSKLCKIVPGSSVLNRSRI